MYRPARVALVLLAAATVVAAVSACEPAPAADKHPSWITRSYYMGNGSGEPARNLGCLNGDKQGRMTLFFGAPTTVSGTYGATLWGAPNRTTGQIAATVREFARGYVFCRQSSSYRLLIGVGTSNSSIDSKSDQWVYGHGRAWATMVRDLSAWASQTYPGHVRIYGAWDAEPSWSSYAKADRWMHGYDDVSGARPLHANNSADGCPQRSSENGSCNNGWNQRAVWHLSWQHDPALPIPQIYATSGANARQWHMLDAYGYRHHRDGMTFFGVMSQWTACRQTSSSCSGINATPHEAYDMLLRELHTRDYTRQASMPGMTDIRWHS
jgi:hypothetical protein